jgi:hypothetical protein
VHVEESENEQLEGGEGRGRRRWGGLLDAGCAAGSAAGTIFGMGGNGRTGLSDALHAVASFVTSTGRSSGGGHLREL